MNVNVGVRRERVSEVIRLPVFWVYVDHEAELLGDRVDGHQQCGIRRSETYFAVALEDIRIRRKHLPQPDPVHGRNTVGLTGRVHEWHERPGYHHDHKKVTSEGARSELLTRCTAHSR